jgi:hypothetical protein
VHARGKRSIFAAGEDRSISRAKGASMTPPRYVVIVTGSREWVDARPIRARLEKYPPGTLVIHGCAPGADTIAADVARELGFGLLEEPYFSHLGHYGGPARNALLVDLGVVYRKHGYTVIVEAFPMPSSRGTWDCTGQAEAAHLVVRVERCKL